MCFVFLYISDWNVSDYNKKSWKHYYDCTSVFKIITVILDRFWWNLNFVDKFLKILKTKCNELNVLVANLFLEHRRTDRHEEDNILFYKFYERTHKYLHTTIINKCISIDGLWTAAYWWESKLFILLNKLTSKGALRYSIIKHSKVWCVWPGDTEM